MRIRVVSRDHWKTFFDFLSEEARLRPVELEVASLEFGDQIEANWTTLEGLAYNPKANVLSIQTNNLEHWIQSPHQVRVYGEFGNLQHISIKDTHGQILIIHFWDVPALPASPYAQRRW